MKRLILASLAVAAMLASCEKTSEVDPTITLAGQKISYSAYAGASTTKGTAINSNTDFQGVEDSYNSFDVQAINEDFTFFSFDEVTYDGSAWSGTSCGYYWPTAYTILYFGAYYPATSTIIADAAYAYDDTDGVEAHVLTFGYEVGEVADQEDIMYAITECIPSNTETTIEVGLHFKHALTQVAFTATATEGLTVTVNSLTICNVINSGSFSASANTNDSGKITEDQGADDATSAGDIWTLEDASSDNLSNYVAAMRYDDTDYEDSSDNPSAILVGEDATALTSTTDVLMLLPQALTAWDPAGTGSGDSELVVTGTASYLAIDCKIVSDEVTIVEGLIYVPFSTEDVEYDSDTDGQWNPGYKITYNLAFGGGYTIPGETEDVPEPGEVPDPDDVVPTLRTITYSVTVDEWIPFTDATSVSLQFAQQRLI